MAAIITHWTLIVFAAFISAYAFAINATVTVRNPALSVPTAFGCAAAPTVYTAITVFASAPTVAIWYPHTVFTFITFTWRITLTASDGRHIDLE